MSLRRGWGLQHSTWRARVSFDTISPIPAWQAMGSRSAGDTRASNTNVLHFARSARGCHQGESEGQRAQPHGSGSSCCSCRRDGREPICRLCQHLPHCALSGLRKLGRAREAGQARPECWEDPKHPGKFPASSGTWRGLPLQASGWRCGVSRLLRRRKSKELWGARGPGLHCSLLSVSASLLPWETGFTSLTSVLCRKAALSLPVY